MAEIRIEHLTLNYINRKIIVTAIDDLSLDFKDGDFNVILGPSGCGKTSLLRAILGFEKYTGQIFLDDVDILNYTTQERNFAYVSQSIVLQSHVTVFDNIAYPLKIRGMEKKDIVERVREVARDLGIEHLLTRKPKQISIGQAQRVAIARAIVKKASVYLFDEPFSNLDEKNRTEGRHFIQRFIKKYSASAIYITHRIEEATSLADKIYVMDEGKIIFYGTPKQLYRSNHPTVVALREAKND